MYSSGKKRKLLPLFVLRYPSDLIFATLAITPLEHRGSFILQVAKYSGECFRGVTMRDCGARDLVSNPIYAV